MITEQENKENQQKFIDKMNGLAEKVHIAKSKVDALKKQQKPSLHIDLTDFAKLYKEGQTIYYIKTNELCGYKEIIAELVISEVTPKIIVAKGQGKVYTISYDEANLVFTDKTKCEKYFKDLVVANELEGYFQRQKQLANKRRKEKNNGNTI